MIDSSETLGCPGAAGPSVEEEAGIAPVGESSVIAGWGVEVLGVAEYCPKKVAYHLADTISSSENASIHQK